MIAIAPLLLSGNAHAAPPATPGSIGIRLLDIPKDAVNDPRAHEYIVDALPPGTTIHRRIVVNNSTPVTQHVSLYAGGAAIVGDKFVPAADDELSGWIQVSPPELSMAAGGMRIATVTLTVPHSASQGERYATVWAQVRQAATASNPVALVSRVGIRVYLDVGAGGDPRSDFRIGSVTARPGLGGSTLVRANVTNTGERAVDVSCTLSLTSSDGTIHAGPYRSTGALTILPGQSGTSLTTIGQALPHGTWSVQVSMTSGTVTHTTSGTIVIGTASALVAQHSSHSETGVILVTIGATIAGLGAIGGGAYAVQRRRRNNRGGRLEDVA